MSSSALPRENVIGPSQDWSPTRKLRSCDPDVTVLVKYHDTDEDGKIEQKEYQFYAPVLAMMSNFIDTALSVEMKEKETRLITFDDVSPEVFELALKFQTVPTAVLSMTPEDAIRVVEFYDKYEFTSGLELCDCILDYYILKNLETPLSEPLEDIDLLVDAVVLAESCNLSKSTQSGIVCMESRLYDSKNRFGAIHFSEDHIRKLHPMFKKGSLTHPQLSKEELESPLFPKYFVEFETYLNSSSNVVSLTMSGTMCSADGDYSADDIHWRFHKDGTGQWNGHAKEFLLDLSHGDGNWCISIRDQGDDDDDSLVVLWKSPHSQNLSIPPKGPWIAVNEHAKNLTGEPKITGYKI